MSDLCAGNDKIHPVIETKGFELHDWQRDAVAAWLSTGVSEDRGARGTLEVFTGGGKTLIALAAAAEVARSEPGLRLAIVVPTTALLEQWRRNVARYTNVDESEVGVLSGSRKDSLGDKRVLICVLNSAARLLPEQVDHPERTMLVLDECHRAGAPKFSAVLDAPAAWRLGLSATPDRQDLDDDGVPLEYDEHVLGRKLGPVIYRFSLKDARTAGMLPEYVIHHHGVELSERERHRYDQLSRDVDEAADRLRERGIDPSRVFGFRPDDPDLASLVTRHQGLTAERKDLLYRASERWRVAERIVDAALGSSPTSRILCFNERTDEAERLHTILTATHPEAEPRLEHSGLGKRERESALRAFREGESRVLVSVKALVEGIDVPEADVGVSVASSSSVRQRIQTLGRVLRRSPDGADKLAHMHVVYVADSVDESIYGLEDWADLTGDANNEYLLWATAPQVQPGPPRQPKPTEDQILQTLGDPLPELPVEWTGSIPSLELSVDTLGNVTFPSGDLVAEPEPIVEALGSLRSSPAGRVWVTPVHHLVVSYDDNHDLMLIARLSERPRPVERNSDVADFDPDSLSPGDPYPGSTTAVETWWIASRSGGIVQKRIDKSTTITARAGEEGSPQARNRKALLSAWKQLRLRGVEVIVNEESHALVKAGGQFRFLADVSGGLSWPRADEDS